jgi:streptogrisin C
MNWKLTLAWIPLLGLATTYGGCVSAESGSPSRYPAHVYQVAALYGIDPQAAIRRLSQESEAIDSYQRILAARLPGYAGAWFEPETGVLLVATSLAEDVAAVHRNGAVAVVVERSLADLDSIRSQLRDQLRLHPDPAAFRRLSVDVKRNAVRLGVEPTRLDAAILLVDALGLNEVVEVAEVSFAPELTTTSIRGADGTRNLTWQGTWGGTWPCSVGAPVTGGQFYTAGHCGDTNDSIGDASSTALGDVAGSTYFTSSSRIDAGIVLTNGSYNPVAQVNGYSDGVIGVEAKWSGISPALLSTTVCRYGQTSGGPHCGEVVDFGADVGFCCGIGTILNLTVIEGACSDDGDSGGTHLAAGTGQVQGVNIGASTGNTCPTPVDEVYFQPIADLINTFGEAVLTSHGASAPTVSGFSCPDMTLSGSGTYYCKIDHYNSQGSTTMSWTSSTLHSSSSTELYGSCTIGHPVSVNLAVTNPYGTTNTNPSFTCPN